MDTLVDVAFLNALLATPLALLAAGASRLLRRPAVTHALWLLVLLKLVTPPLLAVPIPSLGWETPEPVVVPLSSPVETSDVAIAVPVPPVEAEPNPDNSAELPQPTLAAPSWRAIAAVIWLTGSAAWFLLVVVRLYHFRRWLGRAIPASAEIRDRTQRLANALGLSRPPTVWTTTAPLSPLIWAGLGTPRLLLPSQLWERLDEEQRGAVLVHELAHLRRRDYLIHWLELLVVGLYWWNPVVWWACRELREAEEECCDAWVVWALPEAAPAYAAALVETAAFLSGVRSALPIATNGMGYVRTLKRRLSMIVRAKTPRSLTWAGAVALLVLGITLLPMGAIWADKPAESPSPPAPNDMIREAELRETVERDRLNALLDQFNTLYKQGRLEEAEKVAEQAVRQGPDDPRATAALALCRAMRTRPETERPVRTEVTASERAELIQRARDEVELLEAQLAAKKALVDAAKESLELLQQRVRGAPTPDARDAANTQQTQVRVREAELLEPEVRLKQARRRLQALDQPASSKPKDGSSPTPARSESERLRELERKLDRLLEEVESLRRDTPRRRSSRADSSDVLAVNHRDITLPIRLEPERATQVREIRLLASHDRGSSWDEAAIAGPKERNLSFKAPRDGEYWFIVCTVNTKGEREPMTLLNYPPQCKVLVDTLNPEVTLQAFRSEDQVGVSWVARDADSGVEKLELRALDRANPTRIWGVPIPTTQTGKVMLGPEIKGTILVRLTATDRAGNRKSVEADVSDTPKP